MFINRIFKLLAHRVRIRICFFLSDSLILSESGIWIQPRKKGKTTATLYAVCVRDIRSVSNKIDIPLFSSKCLENEKEKKVEHGFEISSDFGRIFRPVLNTKAIWFWPFVCHQGACGTSSFFMPTRFSILGIKPKMYISNWRESGDQMRTLKPHQM